VLQVQTRSADEPMTTFVLCNNCGNRWKVCVCTLVCAVSKLVIIIFQSTELLVPSLNEYLSQLQHGLMKMKSL